MEEKNDNYETKEIKYKIIAVDRDSSMLDSLKIILKNRGYDVECFLDPEEAINNIKEKHYDLLLLGYIMNNLRGDEVVSKIREFNKTLYILLLTGYKELCPPLETLNKLDIQGYWEKNNNFDQLLLLIESAFKSINQMNLINEINGELKNKNEELKKAYLETIGALRKTVEAKDPYTRGHSDRVSEYSVLIGKKLKLDEHTLQILRVGGLFHDIGKIGIPDNILLKDSKLSDNEYLQIQKHPSIGAHILGNVDMFKEIIPVVLYHHERYDGRGYPKKLVGEEIPYVARICSVADTFDAMTSKRSYRDALSLDIVTSEIKKCSGTQFDPTIASAFLDILENDYDSILEIENKYK